MLNIAIPLDLHLRQDVTALTVCWSITRNNGQPVRGTAHDADVEIASGPHAGLYPKRQAVFASDVRSSSDGSVPNVDVEGAFRVDAEVDDMRIEEIEGGLYDQAPALLFLVNWKDPNGGQRVLVSGSLGEFFRDSEGRYRSEVRGLAQALTQQIVRTYSRMCDVRVFGDHRCKKNVTALQRTGTVSVVTSRRRFTVDLDPGPAPRTPVYYKHGRLRFTSGANQDVIREVRVCAVDEDYDGAEVLLWDEAPGEIEVGDSFILPPGCDRQYETCRLIHENILNFRGHGIYAAGRDALMRGAGGADVITLHNVGGHLLTEEEYQDYLEDPFEFLAGL